MDINPIGKYKPVVILFYKGMDKYVCIRANDQDFRYIHIAFSIGKTVGAQTNFTNDLL